MNFFFSHPLFFLVRKSRKKKSRKSSLNAMWYSDLVREKLKIVSGLQDFLLFIFYFFVSDEIQKNGKGFFFHRQ